VPHELGREWANWAGCSGRRAWERKGKEKEREKKESGPAGDSAHESFRKFLKAFHFQIAIFKYQTNLDSIQI
jgi:hypothetical protein